MDRDKLSKPRSKRRATGAEGHPPHAAGAASATAAGNSPAAHVLAALAPDVGAPDPRAAGRMDALNRPGMSPLKKCTVDICQLGNGSPADQLDEYLKIGESTGVECLKMVVKGVIEIFGAEYLRHPTVEDVERLIQNSECRGFPGMLGSVDCMHWHWKKCPVAWKGMYTRGDQGVPTVILEAVASHDHWIWHAFFDVVGSNNDINVLNQSPLFVQQLRGEAPEVQFHVNGRQYNNGYYLGMAYTRSGLFLLGQYVNHKQKKNKLFAQHQEGERKDVECAFGVLQSRFSILKRPARLYDQGDLESIMLACIILHNMVIEDEKDIVQNALDLNEETSTSSVKEATIAHGPNPEMADVIERNAIIRHHATYKQLQSDLIEHIWLKFGNSN